MLRGAVVDPDDVLDLLVIGCDAAPHQTERSGQAVEQVDVGLDAVRLEQRGDRVEAARTGADHGDAERSITAPEGPVFEGLLHSFLAFARRSRGSRFLLGMADRSGIITPYLLAPFRDAPRPVIGICQHR